MHKGRLEAFSDGVIAILITIMVLELKVPHEPTLPALAPMYPVLVSYVLSFVFIAIYWNNHHHLLQATQKVSGPVLWANMHLLFWLSLIPFATAWMGQTQFAQWPVIVYGADLLFCGIAYYILSRSLIHLHGKNSALALAVGTDFKGIISVVIYMAGIALAFFSPICAYLLYAGVAVMWLIPDRRIEFALTNSGNRQGHSR